MSQQADFLISPRSGRAGTDEEVRLTDLPIRTVVLIGFGGIGSPHEILVSAEADDAGELHAAVRIPDWVEPSRTYLFYMAYADQRPVDFSEPFLIVGDDDTVEVEGRLTEEGTTCPAMRGPHDELFTLAGMPEGASLGDTVRVRARVADMSMCMQGLALEVIELLEIR